MNTNDFDEDIEITEADLEEAADLFERADDGVFIGRDDEDDTEP